MLKVIKLDKREYNGKKYNNAHKINHDLAIAENMAVLNIPKRKELRNHIIGLHDTLQSRCDFKISHKDIKRIEKPKKCEIPVNIVDILEIIINEISSHKTKFKYRAEDSEIMSYHVLKYTIESLLDLKCWLDAHNEGIRPECDKYREEVQYISDRIKKFDQDHPGTFDSLFN